MSEQPADTSESNTTKPSAHDALIPILAAVLPGLVTLLTIPSQAPVTGKVIFAVQVVVGVAILVYGWRSLRRNVNRRAFLFAGLFALLLAIPAFLQIPAPSTFQPSEQKPAFSNPSSAPEVSAIENCRNSLITLAFVYVDAGSLDPRYMSSLIQDLHGKNWQVTDNPAQSAVMLHVSVDVAVSPGLSVGSMATWQATGNATLRAFANNSDKPSFENVGHGHAVASQSNHAAENAAADALRQAVDNFDTAARKRGPKP